MKNSIYTLLLTVVLLGVYILPATAQAPTPTPTPDKLPVFGLVRVQDGVQHEASYLKSEDGNNAKSKSTYIKGDFIGFYWITDWGVDCKAFQIRELRVKVYDPKGKQIMEEVTMGPWQTPEKGADNRQHSLGYLALRDFWCKDL